MINAAIGHAVIEQSLSRIYALTKCGGGVLLIIDFFLRGLFMKFKKLSTLLFAFVFAFAFLVASCSNGSDDNSSITLSAEATSATVGDVVSLSVSFSGWSANPAAVDVYVKESSDALKTRVTVSAGKITLDTSYFEPGSYNLYVVSGNVKSNSIEVELMKNALEAPSDVVATVSAATSNTIVIKWTNVSDVSDYWLYCSTTNDLSSATLKTKSADGYKDDSNTSAFSSVASCAITYASLSAPTNLKVSLSETYANIVSLTWDEEKSSANYWIYCSTTNDSSSATKKTSYGYKNYSMQLTKTGTYYFWVKAANGLGSTDGSSEFSQVAIIEFSHEDLSVPTAFTATGSGNSVKLSWAETRTSSGLIPYCWWIYYGTENDSSKATLKSRWGYQDYPITLPASGTYYFWVKAADSYDSTSPASDFSTVATYTY